MGPSDLATLGILGTLAEEETATAERIQSRLQHNFGRYWTGGYGVVLPTLSRLEEREPQPVRTERGEEGTAYALTDAGRQRLQALLKEPIEDVTDPGAYPALVVKLGFLHHLPPEDQRAELAALEDRFEQARDRYLELEGRHEEAVDDARGYRRELLSLRAMVLDDHLEWLRELQETVDEQVDGTRPADPS